MERMKSMKIRNDFVSNSSSCSFLIHIETEDDLVECKQVLQDIIDQFEVTLYAGKDQLTYHMSNVDDVSQLNVDDWIQVYCGEDDSMECIDSFRDVENIMYSMKHQLKIYRDDAAHETFGDKLPNDEQ